MDRGTSAAPAAGRGDHPFAVGPDSGSPDLAGSSWGPAIELGATLAKTVAHFWPDLGGWLGGLADTRDQQRITYSRRFLVWMGLAVFLLKLGSRRQVRFELDSPVALANLNRLAGASQEAVAHGDTLNHFLGHLPERELPSLRRRMVHRLIRMKAVDDGRLLGHFLVDIDGTGQLVFDHRHCPHCLEQTINGRKCYSHHVLEAKLVTPSGLALSIASEFIENPGPNRSTQDCELNAFLRLAERLKKDYPQVRLCLALDALYANGTVFQICRENNWKFIIAFKEGSLPALWREYQTLLGLCPRNRTQHRPDPDTDQTFAWVGDLEHTDDHGRTHRLTAFQCQEQEGENHRFFAWLTNFTVNQQTVVRLANDGGRGRWTIENEGFNIQKNGGFALEHAYSTSDRQIKNFYVLLQLAHLILSRLVGNGTGQPARRRRPTPLRQPAGHGPPTGREPPPLAHPPGGDRLGCRRPNPHPLGQFLTARL